MAEQNFIDYVKSVVAVDTEERVLLIFTATRKPQRVALTAATAEGGNILVRAMLRCDTITTKIQKHVIAGDGGSGGSSRSTGASGEDIVLEVPLGTVAKRRRNRRSTF